jgi:hypothetical protein
LQGKICDFKYYPPAKHGGTELNPRALRELEVIPKCRLQTIAQKTCVKCESELVCGDVENHVLL